MTGEKVLVIGGGGYIGTALLPLLLREGCTLRVMDCLLYGEAPVAAFLGRREVEWLREDFRQPDRVAEAMQQVDAVVHLGGIVGDPACSLAEDLAYEINVTATRTLAEMARIHGVKRFVFSSTCAVYGASHETCQECSPVRPVSVYARHKLASEQLLLEAAWSDCAPTVLRFGTVYGLSTRMRFDLVVNRLVAQAARERRLRIFGGNQWRPFLHVQDAARAIFAVLEAPGDLVAGKVFNVGSNEENYRLATLGTVIREVVPDARVVIDGSLQDARSYRVAFERIKNELGFSTTWTVNQGVRQVAEALAADPAWDYRSPAHDNAAYLPGTGFHRLQRVGHAVAT